MWCLTNAESISWCKNRWFAVEANGQPRRDQIEQYRIVIPLNTMKWSQHGWFSGFAASSLEPYEECLMWVTEPDIFWSENRHLLYRLRESYGERRRLQDAPGHLFLGHEGADLATMIGLGLLANWDFHLVASPGYLRGFRSHDGFLDLFTDGSAAVEELKKSLEAAHIEFSIKELPAPKTSP